MPDKQKLLEISLSWVSGDITGYKAAQMLKAPSILAVYRMAAALRRAYQDGKLIIKRI